MTIDDIIGLAQRVHDRERMNFGSTSTRDSRNRDWARIVGLVHHGSTEYGVAADPRWHIKDGGNGRPQSDDVIVLMPSRDFWDCIPGAGADGYSFVANYDGKLPLEQNVYPPPVPKEGAVTAPPITPLWQTVHTNLLTQLQRKFDPKSQLADRDYVRLCAEQFVYSFPGEGWGMKAADASRPPSDHSIARRTTTGLVSFRIVPDVRVPVQDDIRGQHFIDNIPAVNHLGIEITPPTPVDPPIIIAPPAAPELGELAAAISTRFSSVDAALVAVEGVLQRATQKLQGMETQEYGIRAALSYGGVLTGDIKPKPRQLAPDGQN